MTRTVVITGAASGIGAACTALAREAGDRVIGVDLRDAEVNADLSSPAGRQQAARQVKVQAAGVVDAVIACAGIAQPVPRTISVNYFGVTELLTGLLPALAAARAPRAAVVASIAVLHPVSPPIVQAALDGDEARALDLAGALDGDGPTGPWAVYSSSKRALARWVRREAIGADWAGNGIPLNAVGPGTVLTPMNVELLSTSEGVAMADASVPMPLNYHQSPESVAQLLSWLVSPSNTHTTGQLVMCDGGADATMRGDDIWS